MANELHLTAKWLYSKLTGDAQLVAAATGGIHQNQAREETEPPFVVFNWQGGSDWKTLNATRVWNDSLWLVIGIAKEGATGPLVTIADRIDAALDRASGLVDTARVYFCEREQPFSQPVSENGIRYRQVGGIYRIKIQQPAAV